MPQVVDSLLVFSKFETFVGAFMQKWGSLKNHRGHFASEFQVNFEGATKMNLIICGLA